MRRLLIILGTPIDEVNMEEALSRVEHFVDTGRGTGKTHQIATVNADFVVKALRDVQLRQILQNADMATADGMPLVWGARLLGVPLAGRVTGADMVPALAERAADRGYSVYFLGAGPGIAERAANILKAQHPQLRIAGIASPSVTAVSSGDPAVLEAIRAAKPDILLVAFGNPKQEKWIEAHAAKLGVPVMMGVGGTFDFIAGATKRAPQWMQRTGLEWLHRLAQQPRRLWKRYAVDLWKFSYFFLWQWWIMGHKQPKAVGSLPVPVGSLGTLPSASGVSLVDNLAILTVRGRLESSNQRDFMEKASQAIVQTPHVVVDLVAADFLDSAAIGTLVALTKQARDAGGNLWLINVPPAITRVFALLRLEQFFAFRDSVESVLAEYAGSEMVMATGAPA